MSAWRLTRVGLHLGLGLFQCAVLFPRISPAARQARVRRWSAQLLTICKVRFEILDQRDPGAPDFAGQRALVVSNHVSWLDIFVINAMQPCRFVAKSDIRDWPVLGYLCAQANTIFISRGSPRDVRRTFKHLVGSIEAGERVAFFPEGTTAAQGTLLPFHANLFEAAIDAAVPIQPLALRYVDAAGALYAGVNYIDDVSFAQSMMTILRGPPVRAQILLLPLVASDGASRRVLAAATHGRIAAALGYPPAPGA
ncbi:MAG: 1-acyl-sn-glycerol-3-phosphate acyltransferase [Herminiimonas sp.]|nr:1-acyl-sn-glycerol-3-phosphate acyltransferase [Herminiimonas sp.]